MSKCYLPLQPIKLDPSSLTQYNLWPEISSMFPNLWIRVTMYPSGTSNCFSQSLHLTCLFSPKTFPQLPTGNRQSLPLSSSYHSNDSFMRSTLPLQHLSCASSSSNMATPMNELNCTWLTSPYLQSLFSNHSQLLADDILKECCTVFAANSYLYWLW